MDGRRLDGMSKLTSNSSIMSRYGENEGSDEEEEEEVEATGGGVEYG